MLDWVILIMILTVAVAAILIVLTEQFGFNLKVVETIGKNRLILVIILGSLTSLIAVGLVYSGVLPEAVQETVCRWFTQATQNMLGNACS